MLQGIDVNQKIAFVSKYDKTEPKTTFYFKPISGSERFNLYSNPDNLIMNVLNKAIVEIYNMPNGLKKEDYLNTLNIEPLNELFEKFNEINTVSDDDKKN
jgi:hypothetical protein